MNKKLIQYTLKQLLEATKELNGEFQVGWDEVITDGEKLLEYLANTEIIMVILSILN